MQPRGLRRDDSHNLRHTNSSWLNGRGVDVAYVSRQLGHANITTTPSSLHTLGVEDDRPPICPACGVTMVPMALSAGEGHDGDWICLECEETGEPDAG